MEPFAIVNGKNPLTIFAKYSILDVWQGSKYATVILCGIAKIKNCKPVKDSENVSQSDTCFWIF